MYELGKIIINSQIIRVALLAVVMDTVFGCGRAIRQHSFNSSVGIDGAIRKGAMILSLVFFEMVDMILQWNLVGFIPDQIRGYLPAWLAVVGVADFFGLLYIAYEVVSILKNMTLCGLPVKGVWLTVRNILAKYTNELPDTEEEDEKEKTGVEEQQKEVSNE